MSEVSAPYTDSYIIQCDRNSSLEADTGNNENPAQFTNKQGQGLRLNAGDTLILAVSSTANVFLDASTSSQLVNVSIVK